MQANLFEPAPQLPPIQPSHFIGTSEEDFRAFHEANPQVYRAIREIALDLKKRNVRKAGMKAIFERLRWIYRLQTQGEEYRLNNNYTAFYARMLMDREPELDGFFEVRRLRT